MKRIRNSRSWLLTVADRLYGMKSSNEPTIHRVLYLITDLLRINTGYHFSLQVYQVSFTLSPVSASVSFDLAAMRKAKLLEFERLENAICPIYKLTPKGVERKGESPLMKSCLDDVLSTLVQPKSPSELEFFSYVTYVTKNWNGRFHDGSFASRLMFLESVKPEYPRTLWENLLIEVDRAIQKFK